MFDPLDPDIRTNAIEKALFDIYDWVDVSEDKTREALEYLWQKAYDVGCAVNY